MNFEQARHNMVQQQVRTWEVLDPRVLQVIETMRREDFVLPKHRKLAYADMPLPIGQGKCMMKPVVEGRMLQSLGLEGDEQVLEIGSGSGYISACLGKLATTVLSVEIEESLVNLARRRVDDLGFRNVEFEQGDALGDWDPKRAFDVVVVTASARAVPERFLNWVKPGGRLFMVEGYSPVMEAVLHVRDADQQWTKESLFETDLERLVGAEDSEGFAL